ncbi:MAG: ATP-dependent DNA helicase PcrA [Ignavibacteriaceae bacterium]|nr:ATP-dependent DNA helicase PcrA [Ignavibacteriaceae bacterium]
MNQKKYILTRVGKAGFEKKVDESCLPARQASFAINYQQELNPSQYEAVSAINGAFLIIAGAGTGKTRTLVYRVARLIESGNDPNSILLLTFTRKAANEMMKRASVLLDDRCSKIRGGTFHSFANLTLRKYSKAAGIDSNFTILDQGDSEDIINLIRSQGGLISKERRFPKKETLNKIYSLSANTERPIELIIEEEYPHFLPELDEILKIQKVFVEYKKRNNLLDYDDLLIYLRDFLASGNAAAKNLLSTISFVMVDEYQDTNKLQADIVKGLVQHNGNVMVVGDDAQSIYSFRGANFKNIMEFPKLFPEAQIIKIEENYRSVQSILDFANHIYDGAVEKYTKALYTRRQGGDLPFIVAAANENMQSKFIVEKILELMEEGINLKDIAVLFRSSFFSFDLEIELAKAGIPFQKFGGIKFIEAAHVKDVLAFLRIASNPKDIVSWYRVLLLHDGIGPKTAQRILDEIATAKLTIDENPGTKKQFAYEKIKELFVFLYKLRNSQAPPSELVGMIFEYYLPIFKLKYDDFNKRSKDLETLQNISENYRSLDSFLADMAIEPIIDSVTDIGETDKEDEFLTLSTIHSAKGLEWHSVFVIHAVEGYFPSVRAAESLESLEEERRLMYVASTRAKQNLFVTYPMHMYNRIDGITLSKPSRFISEMSTDKAQGWLVEDEF